MKVFWISLTILSVLLGSALCNECVNNFTSLQDIAQDPSSLLNITLLPRGDERDDLNAFPFRLWVFPNMRFGCSGNLSRIIVRTNARLRENRTAPEVATWKETAIDLYRIVDVPYPDGVVSSSLDMIEYLFNPPLLVMDSQLVGFVFSDTNDQLSLPIAFQDVGANNAPASVHVSALNLQNDFVQVMQPFDPFTRENFRFVPLIAAQFVEEPVITTPPPTTVPMTTTPSPSTPSTTTDPPLDVEVDVGLYAGIAAAFLLVIVIALLAVIIAIVVRRKKAQQKIYEVPVEPTPPNLENPMYGGHGGHGGLTQTVLVNDSHHIYSTPSPTTSPHPPHESQLTTSPHPPHKSQLTTSPHPPHESQLTTSGGAQHYEFAEGYLHNGAESHYEMEPGGSDDPEYALPRVTMQPYEVPLSALQQAGQRVSPISVADQRSKEPIYSVLEEGIYVPTEEERKPYPYSEATIISNDTHDDTSTIYSEMGKKYEGSLTRDGFFQQEDSYWRPASSKTALYDQLSKRKYREIVRQKIQIIKHLGSGQFGTVNMGVWTTSVESIEVAVKTLQPMASEIDKVKFLQEAAIMGQFLHPNVVKLYGVVTVGEPVMIVLEYMQKEDLRNYLLLKRPQPGEMVADEMPQTLLRLCREISAGMNYLANKSFVHRDLAARNVLLSSECTCKIGDFGMSRDLEQSNYYITHGGIIPVKWTAPEALNFRKYSTASDVWSFGCVMYEIWSLGHKPFEGFTNLQCMQLVGSGFRLAPPPGCPRPLYELMIRCWHSDYSVRPMFSAIFNMLSHSPSHLLSWAERDLSIHPQVACLGAPLEVTEELFTELQDYYMISDIQSKRRHKKGSKTADW
ncbi:probable LIM domain-containing serine/threonine-protein kinase DDB_G0286997 isoform X2 [Halichondria panicea]|uniref:probable LIM domain-containing serine/threonine-protein kinase DDB_G0286997 isoform X2 n=1 Tax=Halichondria panicea TaxID=6063 RepID=UPI00312B2BC5